MPVATEYKVHLRNSKDHPHQDEACDSEYLRNVIKAGRRGGKTVLMAKRHVKKFLAGHRVLYGAPTVDQVGTYWFEVCRSLREPIEAKIFKINNSEHYIELPGTKQRIKAKTCWNAETLRGDYADELGLDEYQLMNEDTWEVVGAPMLLDNNGTAVFIYTPPSLLSAGVSKARDPLHATKLFKKAESDTTGRWKTFYWPSYENPYINKEALKEITKDMSQDSYRREILAIDDEEDTNRLVYRMFDERTQLIDPIPLAKESVRYSWHDFGSANPAALFAAMDVSGNIYIYDEYLPGPGKSTFQHVEEFKKRTQGLTVLKRIGGNQTTEDEIRQGYSAHGWPIVAPKWEKVNKQLEIAFGLIERNRVFVFRTCSNLLNDIRRAVWEVDTNGIRLDKIKDERIYHLLACLRYGLSDFTPETVEQSETPANMYTWRRR